MKKWNLIIVSIAVIAFAAMLLGGCGAGNTPAPSAPESTLTPETSAAPAAPSEGITESEAFEIALKDAGFKEEEVSIRKLGLEIDDGVEKIEVEFTKDNMEYDYDIDAKTGAILSKDNEIEADSTELATEYADGAKISDLEALDIVIKDAGISKDDITSSSAIAGIDDDDGVLEYDVEIHVGNMEYSYDIDAVTGAIRDKSAEIDD